jgi:apolipoprotein N-acyltransferase
VIARTGVFEPGVLDLRLPLRDPQTVADRIGAWPEWLISGLAGLALVLAFVQSRGARRANGLDLDSRVIEVKAEAPTRAPA